MFPTDKYPYTNFHELNLGYFIVHFKEIFSQWADLYDQMLSWKDATEEELAAWKASVESDLDQREAALRAELDAWKTQTGQDIAGWEDATLATLTAWQTATQAVFEAIRVEAAGSATAAAASATTAAAAKTAAETAQAAAEAAASSIQASAAQIAANATDISELNEAYKNNLNGVNKSLGVQYLPFEYGGRYLTGTDGNQGNWTDHPNWCGMLIPASEGDTFHIKLYGGIGNTRVYQFMASDYSNLDYSTESGLTDGVVTAPANTVYAIFNNRTSDLPSGYYVYKVNDGIYQDALEYVPEIPSIIRAIGEIEESILTGFESNYYWNSESTTAIKTSYSGYFASYPIPVTEGDKIKAHVSGPSSQRTNALLIVDEDYGILARYGVRNASTDYEFSCPENSAFILITAGNTTQRDNDTCILIEKTNVPELVKGRFNYNRKNVAIIGDSISTNGNFGPDNPLGNVPEIVIQDEDVGVALSAYATYYDIGTVVGGHEIVAADVGTEITFTPVAGDVGKVVGKPLNNNSATINVWWEVAAEILGFNPIPVCWSGASITSHEGDINEYKTSYAWHPAQIRKCGIRTPGTMDRTAPDIIIIYRGTNDFSHSPYSKLTDNYFGNSWTYPQTDVITNGYGFKEGLCLTIKKLRDAYPKAQIILCTCNFFKRVHYSTYPVNNGLYTENEFNNAIREVAEWLQCEMIEFDKDGLTFENASSTYYQDSTAFTHPTTAGHKILGNRALVDLTKINSLY